MVKIKVRKQVKVGLEGVLVKLTDDEIEFVPRDSFEIEVEQEIDESTKLEGLVEKFEDCNGYVDYTNFESSQSIKSALKLSKGVGATSLAFYLEQDNHELQLIWKEGEFVD